MLESTDAASAAYAAELLADLAALGVQLGDGDRESSSGWLGRRHDASVPTMRFSTEPTSGS
jgi:hypothetical protein